MLKKNEIYRTAVSGFTSEGLGVCRVDGCAVFVPNAAPDEEYDLRITHVGRHAAYGRIERILTASPDRCTRLCPDAKRCGGCDFWHLRYPAECPEPHRRAEPAARRPDARADVRGLSQQGPVPRRHGEDRHRGGLF